MTWKDLIKKLSTMNEEQLNADVTILFDDEFYRINGDLLQCRETDILDKGHLFLDVDD